MESIELNNIIFSLSSYIEKEDFKGWDPYDYLLSWVPFRWFGKMTQAIAVQAGKLMPINLRPLMGIPKENNPKGLSLMLRAYCNMYEYSHEGKYLEIANKLFHRIMSMKNDSKYLCWGYPFVWANPHHVHAAFTPSIVVEAFVGFGLFRYFEVTKDEEAKKAIIKMSDFVHECLIWTKTKEGCSISYTREESSYCYNATILGAALLARIYSLTKDCNLKSEVEQLTSFVLAHQKEDGHWEYSMNPNTGQEYSQIDFHQGFIVSALADVEKYCYNGNHKDIRSAIRKGLEYYRKVQFKDYGVSLWRIPKEYPVEIHNQSQGIITFSDLSSYDSHYLEFANTIAEWTINNMRSREGFFYYRKYQLYTIKIPYMRWSQAWMLLALVTLRKRMTERQMSAAKQHSLTEH